MKILILSLFTLISFSTHASTICLVQEDAGKTAFENDKLKLLVVDSKGNRLLAVKATVTETDSAPFNNVIKTYSQDSYAGKVTAIHYLNKIPHKLIADNGGQEKELSLVFDQEQSTAQGAACYGVMD